MLRHLRLEEFLLLEEADLPFGPGLNVITGETGTGKSILCDAIGFVAGGRSEIGWVRSGAERMRVEAEFDLSRLPGSAFLAGRLGIEVGEGTLTLCRELSSKGRSKGWVQGHAVRISELREVGATLLAIHGQGEHRRLLEASVQLELLDRFAGAIPLRERYLVERQRWLDARETHQAAIVRLADLKEKEEWHRDQLEEIDRAEIEPGEEAALREKRDRVRHAGAEIAAQVDAQRLLFEDEGSALDRIETVLHQTERLSDRWADLRAEIGRAKEALRRARQLLPECEELQEEEIDRLEGRLSLFARLKKKYGGTEEAVLSRRASLAALLEETDMLQSRVNRTGEELAAAEAEAAQAGLRLRQSRRRGVGPLCRALVEEIRELGMNGAELDFALEEESAPADDALTVEGKPVRALVDGIDRGSFRLRPNRGEKAGALADVASGGELSRVLLALLTVLGDREEPRSAIFDEVDAGVGGKTARAVAARLARLARDRQVLLVTHLPLIACRAATHFRVEKGERRGRTFGTIAPLDRTERVEELARMLAGEVDSRIARKHAEELLAQAAGSKESG